MRIAILVVASLFVSLCTAQTTRPATSPANEELPRKVKRWGTKPGAPESVRQFVNTWTQRHQAAVALLEREIPDWESRRREELKNLIEQNEDAAEQIVKEKRMRTVDVRYGGTRTVIDEEFEREKRKKLDAIRKSSASAKKELRQFDEGTHPQIAAMEKRLVELKKNTLYRPEDEKQIRLAVGEFGYIGQVHVVQIWDKSSALCNVGANIPSVRVSGLDFSDKADGTDLSYGNWMEVVGTHTYSSTGGSKRTVFDLRPIDFEQFLTVVEVDE